MREDLVNLIGEIYDAGVDPDLWERTLASIARSFGSSQALMVHTDNRNPARERIVCSGMDLGVIDQWKGCKEHVDVWLQQVFSVAANQAYFCTDIVSRRALLGSGFHADILRPLGIEYSLGGIPQNDRAANGFVAIYNSGRAGHYSLEQKARYEFLIPHLRRAWKISRYLAIERSVGATAQAVGVHPRSRRRIRSHDPVTAAGFRADRGGGGADTSRAGGTQPRRGRRRTGDPPEHRAHAAQVRLRKGRMSLAAGTRVDAHVPARGIGHAAPPRTRHRMSLSGSRRAPVVGWHSLLLTSRAKDTATGSAARAEHGSFSATA